MTLTPARGMKKGGLDYHELVGLANDDRLVAVHEEKHHGAAEKEDEEKGQHRVDAANHHACPQAGEDALCPAGADVLPP